MTTRFGSLLEIKIFQQFFCHLCKLCVILTLRTIEIGLEMRKFEVHIVVKEINREFFMPMHSMPLGLKIFGVLSSIVGVETNETNFSLCKFLSS